MSNWLDRHIYSLINGHERNGRVRWRYVKGDVYNFLRAINSPSEYSLLTHLIPELSSLDLQSHITEQGKSYFSTREGGVEFALLVDFLQRHGGKEEFAELAEQRQKEQEIFAAELVSIKERINRGDIFSVDDFVNRYPELYEDPIRLWPDIEDEDGNQRFFVNSFDCFSEKWVSRFVYYPILLRSIQYASRGMVEKIFAMKILPRKDEIVSVICTALTQLVSGEITPNALEVAAYLTQRCLAGCIIDPFRDSSDIGEGCDTIAYTWHALARHFHLDPTDTDDVQQYCREVSAVAQQMLADIVKIKPL